MIAINYDETNLLGNKMNLFCQSTENPCTKRFLTKRKGTQVSYQYLRSNMVRATSTRFVQCFARSSPREQQSPGLLHLDGFESCFILQKYKKGGGCLPFYIWCGQQDSNLHAFAVEPKSTESTNSTMPAYSFVPLIFTRRGIRGGAFRLIHDL